jgi:cytochrome c
MKMKLTAAALATFAMTAAPVMAEGDAAKGERGFRVCAACHVIDDPDGNRLAGRGAKTGPNLYNIIGRTAGTYENFRYRDALPAAGEAGLVWDTEKLAEYLPDPQGFLRTVTGDDSLRSAMAAQRVRGMEDLMAFLTLHSPDAMMMDGEADEEVEEEEEEEAASN